MNNEKQGRTRFRRQGFLAGFLTAVLALALGGAALAATHSIQIDDGIKVTINGAYFSPKDAKGKDISLFTYNGTTYAPIRALCEAAGMRVEYDSAARTARITTADRVLAADPNAAAYITADKAKEIALNHAGVKAADAVFLLAGLDWDDGRAHYEVEFYSGSMEYDYDIDAVTGAILSFDHELDRYRLPNSGQSPSVPPAAPVSPAPSVPPAASVSPAPSAPASSEGLITETKAREIAQGRAPGAQVVKCKLDWDDGQYVYEIELREGRTEYECEINAATGAVLKWDVDYDD